jgi:hypothetical protein
MITELDLVIQNVEIENKSIPFADKGKNCTQPRGTQWIKLSIGSYNKLQRTQ